MFGVMGWLNQKLHNS